MNLIEQLERGVTKDTASAQRTYGELLARNESPKSGDAHLLANILAQLGLPLSEFDKDCKAAKQAADAKAAGLCVTQEEIDQLAERFWKAKQYLEKEIPKIKKAAEDAEKEAAGAHTSAVNRNAQTTNKLDQLKRSNPRAFGIWPDAPNKAPEPVNLIQSHQAAPLPPPGPAEPQADLSIKSVPTNAYGEAQTPADPEAEKRLEEWRKTQKFESLGQPANA